MNILENKYVYRQQDITTDVIMKIESVANLIADREPCDFDSAYHDFVSSKVYGALRKTESLMWAESAEFIADEYYREQAGKTHPEVLI